MTGSEAKQKLDDVLTAFCQQTGAHGLLTNEAGVCSLIFDDRMDVNLLADAESEHLIGWTSLGLIDPAGAEGALRALLQANLFWKATGGGTLALVPESDEVLLTLRRPLGSLDVDGLRDVIETLVERFAGLEALLSGKAAAPAADVPVIARHAVIRG